LSPQKPSALDIGQDLHRKNIVRREIGEYVFGRNPLLKAVARTRALPCRCGWNQQLGAEEEVFLVVQSLMYIGYAAPG
jgi:hypothetical protein